MVRPRPQIDRRLFVSAAALFGASTVLGTVPAWADDEDDKEKDPDDKKKNDEPDAEEKLAQADAVYQRVASLQSELAEAAQAYYQALDEHEAAVNAVDDAQRRIDEASTQIDTLQDRLAKRAVGMYKAGKFTVIDLLMGSASFKEFATGLDMYDALNENDERMIEETKALRDQVAADKEQLELQEQAAKEAAEEAERVKNEAQEKVAAMQAILQQLDEEAKAALESMQDRDRAEAAQASSAQVRRAYAYNIPSVPIPANGSVVDYALSRIGCPYVWGAEGPETFDCSGLVRWAYLQVGISLPHQTESLYYAAAAQLPVEDAQPGDVLWISYGDGYNGHVAIACNEGVHALRARPHVRRLRARHRPAVLGRLHPRAALRVRARMLAAGGVAGCSLGAQRFEGARCVW